MNRHSKFIIFSLVLSVASLNAIILFAAIPEGSRHLNQFYNGDQYADGIELVAANLASGNGYRFFPDTARTLMREPGWPVLLAGIFVLFGKSFAAVKLTNMLLALAAAYLITRIARKLSSNWLLVLASPLLFLFHPGTLIAESRGGSEVLFTFWLTLFILTVHRAVKSGKWWDYLLSGVVLGLTVLVRSTPILFPLVLLAYLLVFERQANPKIAVFRNITAMSVAMFVVLSPWIIRNYTLTGKFVPTASVLGVSAQTGFYLATHHPIGNLYIDREAAAERNRLANELGYHFKDGYYQYFYSSTDEVNFSHYLLKRVMDEYQRSPVLFAKVVGINFFNFWCGGRTWKSVAMSAAVQIPLLVLAITGIVFSVRNGQGKSIAPMSLLIAYIVAISVPILALARYSVPLIPFMSILACTAVVAVQRKLKGEDKQWVQGIHPAVVGKMPSNCDEIHVGWNGQSRVAEES
jgi:4-amino-4-deoxy-L-arabinose transferase-like glycosyltransferase